MGGGKLQLAPDTSANFNVEYVRSIGSNLELTAQIDVNYTDDILLANDNDPHPAQTQDAFTKVDARIFLGSLESGWRVGIVGKNLSDKIAQSWANDLPIVSNNNYFAHIDRPRSIAIQVSWGFW